MNESQALTMQLTVTAQCGFVEPKIRRNEVGCIVTNCIDDELFDCCVFGDSTIIDSRDFSISNAPGYEVLHLHIRETPSVAFLPILTCFKFPNLESYQADNCNIGEISKMNFVSLESLLEINLAGNRIEMVPKNTFEGLDVLETIFLSELMYVKYAGPASVAFDHFSDGS